MALAARRKRRTYHHGDLRAALIEAAGALIHEHGARAFSLREAARMVGVDAAACYRHFRDRQDVLVAIAQLGFARLAKVFAAERARHAASDPRTILHAFGQRYLDGALRQPAEFRVMFGDCGYSARDQRLRLPEVEISAYEHLEAVAAGYLQRAPLAIDASSLANIFWVVAHGVSRLMIDGALPVSEAEARRLLDCSIAAILDGLPPPTG